MTIDDGEIQRIIERLTAPSGRRADLRSPVVDLRLVDGHGRQAVLPRWRSTGPTSRPTVRSGPVPWPTSARPIVELLSDAGAPTSESRHQRRNGQRQDDVAQRPVRTPRRRAHRHHRGRCRARSRRSGVVRLESRPATSEGMDAVTIGDLVRASLRMRPDRVIVGEVRGPEAADMLWAMNTGHDGSMTTCHANSPSDALARLEAMACRRPAGWITKGCDSGSGQPWTSWSRSLGTRTGDATSPRSPSRHPTPAGTESTHSPTHAT